MTEPVAVKKTDNKPLSDHALDQLFRDARTFNAWEDRKISQSVLHSLYDLTKWGPTSANCQPARFIFVTSETGKARLKPHLAEGNIEKTMTAPCTVIIAHDYTFYENLPEQFPHADAKSWFASNDSLINQTAPRNASLQAGYFILAARALGLDTGALSGFDIDGVTQEFCADMPHVKADLLCNIGYGTTENLFPRSPRLSFDQACQIV